MSGIKIKQEVDVYEVDDVEVPISKTVTIGIDSHWNNREVVVILVGRKSYAVIGSNLITAINNAMNSGRP